MKNKISIFWFRRDLRLDDNKGLYNALKEKENVLPIFIFDKNILNKLEIFSISELIGNVITNIINGNSLSLLFEY